MIDWLSFELPYSWDVPIQGGQVIHLKADGSLDFAHDKTLWLHGSYDSRMSVVTRRLGFISVSGNPTKFLQGHNLFGSDDLLGLVLGVMARITELLGLEPTPEDRAAWLRGDFEISRVDCTYMYELARFEDVGAWLLAASSSASIKWRGRGHYQDGTLYFGKVAKGKRASDWQLKLYHKGAEVLIPGHQLPSDLPCREELISWSRNKLRIELCLRTGELKRVGLRRASDWVPGSVSRVFSDYLAKLEIGEDQMVEIDLEEGLKPRQRSALALWRSGVDVRTVYDKRTTFYRLRKEILDAVGVDIGSLCSSSSNVVKLKRTLEAVPATVPEWASPVYYEPPPSLRLVA